MWNYLLVEESNSQPQIYCAKVLHVTITLFLCPTTVPVNLQFFLAYLLPFCRTLACHGLLFLIYVSIPFNIAQLMKIAKKTEGPVSFLYIA